MGSRATPCVHVALPRPSRGPPFSVLPARYLIGGLGTGATPQIAAGHAGSCGVGMRDSFPWVDAEPPVLHVPVKALMLGKVLTVGLAGSNPSVSACMMITSWFSS